MAVRKITTEISLSGEKAFNDQMKAVNSNLKTLKTDMAVVSSEFKNNANSVEALRAKQAVLQEQYDQQREKVRALNEMVAKAIESGNEDAAVVDKYRQQLNAATVTLNNFSEDLAKNNQYLEEAEKSSKGTASSIDQYGKTVKDAGDKTNGFSDVVKVAVGNLAAGGIKAALTSARDKVTAYWDSIKAAPLDLIQGAASALYDMGKAVYEQTVASAAYADNILTMSTNTGISTTALQEYQYMAELTDTSVETITGSLRKLTNNMDSARAGTGSAANAFNRLGVAVTKEDGSLRSNQEVFGEVLDKLGAMENATERDAISMDIFGKSAQDLNSLIAAGSEGIAAFADEAHKAGAVLDTDTLNALGAVDDSLQRFRGTMDAVKTAMGAEFAEPVATIMSGLTQIMQGNVDEGLESIISGIDQAIEIVDELLPQAEEFLAELLGKLTEYLPELLSTGVELITSLITGIAQTAPELIPQMTGAILLMVQTLTEPDNLSQLVSSGIELILQLIVGLAQAIPELVPAVLEAVGTIAKTIWDHRGDIVDAGKDLIKGLWEGIKAMGAWLWKQVSGFFGGLVDDIKEFFGIHSPSTLFENEIGRYLALGVGKGFAENMDAVNKEMLDAVNTDFTLTPNVELQRGLRGGQDPAVSAVREDMQNITAGLVNGLQTAVSGAQGVPESITVNLTLPDGTRILRYFINLAQANGTPIANPI